MKTLNDSLGALLESFAKNSPEKRFLFTDTRCYSAEETYKEAAALAAQLSLAGVCKGDMVVLRAVRSIDTALIFFTLESMGVTAILTDPHSGAKEAVEKTAISFPIKAYVTNEAAQGGLAAEGNWKIITDAGESELAFGKDGAYDFENIDAHTPGVVIFTSGSTGGSKAVVLTQYNMVNHAENYGWGGCYRESDVSATILPFYHVYGLAYLLTALRHHYELYFIKDVSPDSILEVVQTHGITRVDGVPSLMLAIADRIVAQNISPASLRIGIVGGAPISEEQYTYIEKTLGITLVPVYGMSECIGITGLPENTPQCDRRLTVGKFLPMNEGAIMDESGNRLPAMAEGEICVRSVVVTPGYYGDSEATARLIDSEGWLHTGDLGYVDEKGLVHISGRKKDIIIRNGNNISSNDIERAIRSVPGVKDALVVGIKDEREGEVPAAMICAPGRGEVSREELAAVMAKNAIPAVVMMVDAIPLTSSGKPDKQGAKKTLAEIK